ncbi:MAG: hypothetical protein RMJ59_03295 [Candidatus Nitrosocaldus sp.]|nr:hypothetical protein [Candidatus Nitrosocaldus sp.]MDW8275392.1 hypothetical protein [Candidatus Nitrosocaldus sp.]
MYQRIRLAPWWFSYKIGLSKQALLQDKIIDLAQEVGIQDLWAKSVVNFAITEFSKKGLGPDYYGYHNIDHELEATYFTLLVAEGLSRRLSRDDLYYLFLAALFHDFDPLKDFDRPNEDSVEWFLRNNKRIVRFVEYVGLSLDIVVAMIYRTAFPFKGEVKERALRKMDELFTSAGIPEGDPRREHYMWLGWIVSIAERVAGYAMKDYNGSMELAMKNAHALGWHPSIINREAVKYFNSMLEEERDMLDLILSAVPVEYRERFYRNVNAFKEAYARELEAREMIRQGLIGFAINVERNGHCSDSCIASLLRLHKLLPLPLRMSDDLFISTLKRDDTLLITLRGVYNGKGGSKGGNEGEGDGCGILGYSKGGPLELYRLRRGTKDENRGRRNTIYLEPISIDYAYWGANGGHLLRYSFILEAKRRGYRFLTAYAHRSVIEERIAKGEPIEVVCKYDPDRFDYYRYDLSRVDEDSLAREIGYMLRGS